MKKHIGLIVTALLLISVLAFTGCKTASSATPEDVACGYLSGLANQDYNKMDKYSLIKQEQLFRPIIEEQMKRYSKTEAEIYAMLLEDEDIDKMPVNFSQYVSTYKELMTEKFKEQYGEDYSINATVISITDMSEEDKSALLLEASDYFDELNVKISDIVGFSKIESVKTCKCKLYIKGSKDEQVSTVSIYVAKTGGAWKVLNIGVKEE